jgi:hypothetical protein
MDYWVLGSDNSAKGPYSEERLKSAAKDGSLRGDRMICAVGSNTWATVAATFGPPAGPAASAASPPPRPPIPAAPAPPQSATVQLDVPAAEWVPIGYLWPVVCTLCCSPVGLIGGVVAIVCAVHANSLGARGEIARAARLARACKWWMIATCVVGALFNITYALVSIVTMSP